jgi:hypothetical protein
MPGQEREGPEEVRRLTIGLALIGLLLAAPASAKQPEQRVTELVSKLPAGVADTGVCGAQRHGCDINLTTDRRFALFATNGGPLIQWHDGSAKVVSDGPLGVGAVGGSCYPYNGPCYFTQTDDGRRIVFTTASRLVPEDTARGVDVYLRTPAGTQLVSSEGPANGEYSYRAGFGFVSPAADRIFYGFSTFGDPDPWMYEWIAGGPHKFPSESNPAAFPNILKWLSPDGEHVLFMTPSALVPEDHHGTDIYERTQDGHVNLISNVDSPAGSEVEFYGASRDGSRVFFTVFKPPVFGGPPAPGQLYERDANGITLVAGKIARKNSGWDYVSDDGTAVFTTDESLVPEDQDGAVVYDPLVDDFVFKNDPDVYRWSNGRYELVSTGPLAGDGRINPTLQNISADGRDVYFLTSKALVPEDTNGAQDLYVRDTVKGETRLATPQSATDVPNVPGDFLGASTDGRRVFFQTDQALVPGDTDRCISYEGKASGCNDIYERFAGRYTLVSTGPSDHQGTCDDSLDFGARVCPSLAGISPDGKRVFFQTRLSLTTDDTDGGLTDIYVSRVVDPGCRPKGNGKLPDKCWGGK